MYLIMRQNKIKKERAVTNSALMFLFSLFYLLSLIYNTFLCFFPFNQRLNAILYIPSSITCLTINKFCFQFLPAHRSSPMDRRIIVSFTDGNGVALNPQHNHRMTAIAHTKMIANPKVLPHQLINSCFRSALSKYTVLHHKSEPRASIAIPVSIIIGPSHSLRVAAFQFNDLLISFFVADQKRNPDLQNSCNNSTHHLQPHQSHNGRPDQSHSKHLHLLRAQFL